MNETLPTEVCKILLKLEDNKKYLTNGQYFHIKAFVKHITVLHTFQLPYKYPYLSIKLIIPLMDISNSSDVKLSMISETIINSKIVNELSPHNADVFTEVGLEILDDIVKHLVCYITNNVAIYNDYLININKEK